MPTHSLRRILHFQPLCASRYRPCCKPIALARCILGLGPQLRTFPDQTHSRHVVVETGPRRLQPDLMIQAQLPHYRPLVQVVTQTMHPLYEEGRFRLLLQGIRQAHPGETFQRRHLRCIHHLSAETLGQIRELLWPLINGTGVAEPIRMVRMPVRLSIGLLTVVANQDDPLRTPMRSQRNGAQAGILTVVKRRFPNAPDSGQWRPKLTGKTVLGLFPVLFPPNAVHGVQDISPWSHLKSGVGDDYSAVFRARPPRPDRFAVVCREAWAACDADDGSPAAS
ncbi:hypothetical protein LMG26685_02887 [Achromobacter mucicolens]|nr:hypothetical protein LMG26685_02887 [Achromobacter mucicolens]